MDKWDMDDKYYRDLVYTFNGHCEMGMSKNDENNLRSLLYGLMHSKENGIARKVIGTYLKEEYSIEFRISPFEEWIDAYCEVKGLNWFDGLFKLLWEVYKTKRQLHIMKTKEENEITETSLGKVTNVYETKDGKEIRPGSIMKLTDKIQEEYKKTKIFDINLKNPSWELFFPSEHDFNSVKFFSMGNESSKWLTPCTFGRARRIMSDCEFEIKEIRKQGEKVYLYSDILEIDIETALDFGEIELLKKKTNNNSSHFSALEESIENYRLGLYGDDYGSVTSVVDYWSYNYVSLFKKPWENYFRAITRIWYKKT